MSRSRHDALRTLAAALAEDAEAIRSLGRAEFDTTPFARTEQGGAADQLALGPAISRARDALAAAYADSARRVAALAAEHPPHPDPSRDPRA